MYYYVDNKLTKKKWHPRAASICISLLAEEHKVLFLFGCLAENGD
jgi:hypothetical protein